MVEVSRHMGRITLMTAIAAVLVAGAFSFPWYTYRYSVSAESAISSDHWSANGFIQFYPDHSSDEDGALSSYASFWHEPQTPFASLFSAEAAIGALWVLVAMAFIGFVFMDIRLGSLVAGAFIFTVGLLMLLMFVFRFGDALADSSVLNSLHLPTAPEVGFIGSHTDIWTNDSWTYQQSVGYGPSWGFGIILLAFALQTIAFALRTSVAMPSVAKESRGSRDTLTATIQVEGDASRENLPDGNAPPHESK